MEPQHYPLIALTDDGKRRAVIGWERVKESGTLLPVLAVLNEPMMAQAFSLIGTPHGAHPGLRLLLPEDERRERELATDELLRKKMEDLRAKEDSWPPPPQRIIKGARGQGDLNVWYMGTCKQCGNTDFQDCDHPGRYTIVLPSYDISLFPTREEWWAKHQEYLRMDEDLKKSPE